MWKTNTRVSYLCGDRSKLRGVERRRRRNVACCEGLNNIGHSFAVGALAGGFAGQFPPVLFHDLDAQIAVCQTRFLGIVTEPTNVRIPMTGHPSRTDRRKVIETLQTGTSQHSRRTPRDQMADMRRGLSVARPVGLRGNPKERHVSPGLGSLAVQSRHRAIRRFR